MTSDPGGSVYTAFPESGAAVPAGREALCVLSGKLIRWADLICKSPVIILSILLILSILKKRRS